MHHLLAAEAQRSQAQVAEARQQEGDGGAHPETHSEYQHLRTYERSLTMHTAGCALIIMYVPWLDRDEMQIYINAVPAPLEHYTLHICIIIKEGLTHIEPWGAPAVVQHTALAVLGVDQPHLTCRQSSLMIRDSDALCACSCITRVGHIHADVAVCACSCITWVVTFMPM